MSELFVLIAILLPALTAALCFTVRNRAFRNMVVTVTTLVMVTVAVLLTMAVRDAGGVLTIKLGESLAAMNLGLLIKALDLGILIYVGYIGVRLKKPLALILAAIQLVAWTGFEVFGGVHEPETAVVIDYLALVMILLVSIVGPIITVFAIGYMEEHEHHLHLKKSRQPRFFAVIFVFLAAMNALVMTNNLTWMYTFWEITTLCSFLLISHDGNEQSIKNALRALILNSVGGVAFIFGIIAVFAAKNTLAVDEIAKAGDALTGLLPVGLALLCVAGFTKSAQFPFQSWLLGAMVAPTPVSALLHSSTMVKAGVYLVVRLSPAMAGTLLGHTVAAVGGFTFLAGSAIAISQSNSKRVLAYSTIANLGLIICCAGLGSNVAIGAAILLMIFHALSKGMLFLCVGTVEQGIGSRDIEDMQGLMKKMPFTAVTMVIGMVSMLLPPFGVLVTKWLAIEASVNLPVVMVMIVLGSAFTVVFWAKWIGITLTMSYKKEMPMEKIPFSVRSMLSVLLVMTVAASVAVAPMYNFLIKPFVDALSLKDVSDLGGDSAGMLINSMDTSTVGAFAAIPLFLILFGLVALLYVLIKRTGEEHVKPPYLCGENVDNDIRGLEFWGPADAKTPAVVRNYYLTGTFGENRLTIICNVLAIAFILIMFGVVIR